MTHPSARTEGARRTVGFEDELNVETPAGRAAHVKGEEPLVYDGFLVRFAPAPPPE